MTASLDARTRSGPRPGTASRAPGKRARPSRVLACIWVGAALVLLLWWHDTAPFSGLGDWLTNAGRITGLVAGYAVVVLLALMARIPSLERGVGTDRLARWHAAGGRYVVGLVVAHGLLITWGYAVTARTDPIREGRALLTSYPDVLMATVAGLLLVGIGIVSARAARARLRYETWYYLHLYTYLAVALAFSHQFATGADFMTNGPARIAWSAMYAVVAVLLVRHRLITPVLAAVRHRLRVIEVRREATDVVSVVMTGRRLSELAVEPGQFFRWRFLVPGLWWSANPYSLSAAPHPRALRITVKEVGDHSRALSRLKVGTPVIAEGPYGALTAARRRRRKVLLIAGGSGITPLRALFETLPAAPGDLTLLYRANDQAEVVLRRELDHIAAARGARVHYLLGHWAELHRDPLSAEALMALVPDLRHHDIYLCGPPGMLAAAKAGLRRAGVARRHVHHESFEL
ncbi:MAG: ferric reductase-like transmembrane domain-containing protein [Frankiaceae bacterium]